MKITQHLRVLEPLPGIVAYYDGRVPGHRFAERDNWVDDGALSLGIASYAVVSGDQALAYDTQVSVAHGAAIRADLQARGVRRLSVVLSHWHLDHVAGTAAFDDCEVIANRRTRAHLEARRVAIEEGTDHGWPAICPLVMPDVLFSGQMHLAIGTRQVALIEANIHSDDATVLWLPQERVLIAGDTVEDCATYVGAPQDLATHQAELARLGDLGALVVLPCHGDPDIIAAGGYGADLLEATSRYIGWLRGLEVTPDLATTALADVVADDLAKGTLRWFAPYEAIHRQNIARALAHFGRESGMGHEPKA